MVFTCSEKPLHTLLCLSEVPPTLSLKQFLWPSLVLSRKIVWQFLFPCLSPPAEFSSRWYLCVMEKFPQHCLWNSSKVRLIDNGPLLSFQGRSSNASSFHTSLLQVIDGVMPLAFCLQVVSQAPSDLPRHKPLVMAALPSSISLSIHIYLLGHFPLLWHVQGSTPRGVFRGGHWPLTHSSLQFAQQANFITWLAGVGSMETQMSKNLANITYINYPPTLFTVRDYLSFKGTSLLKFVSNSLNTLNRWSEHDVQKQFCDWKC